MPYKPFVKIAQCGRHATKTSLWNELGAAWVAWWTILFPLSGLTDSQTSEDCIYQMRACDPRTEKNISET